MIVIVIILRITVSIIMVHTVVLMIRSLRLFVDPWRCQRTCGAINTNNNDSNDNNNMNNSNNNNINNNDNDHDNNINNSTGTHDE